ncbi:MAG: hypothetical protein RMK74_15855 [Myxococcales bacterium]|nr:hypothetical protein [Myxococcales bacterium]
MRARLARYASVMHGYAIEPSHRITWTLPIALVGSLVATSGAAAEPHRPGDHPPPAGQSPQERRLAEEEEEDDGRDADLLWIEGGFGYSYVDLGQFSRDNFLPHIERYRGSGYAAELAAGFRVTFLAVGARATLASYPGSGDFEGFEVGHVALEATARLPTPVLEPYARLAVGYGWVGSANYDVPAMSETDVYGLVASVGAGLDLYLDRIFALGVGMEGAFLNLTRQELRDGCMGSDCEVATVELSEDGDALGLQLRLMARASLHF